MNTMQITTNTPSHREIYCPVCTTVKTPWTMYFTFKNDNFAINCDWLQYSVTLVQREPTLTCPEGYRIEQCQGNNIFENRALVFDPHGRKLLTLLWKPYSSVLNPLIMTVQVANQGLYIGEIESSLNLVKQIVCCTFNSIGRFDVCCDFTMTDKRAEMVKHLNSGHIYVERKSEGSAFWHEIDQNGFKHKQTHCISWGSKTSEIKVKLYNKTRELGMTNGGEPEKPWIVEEWNKAGIDKTHAWRLEFSLKSNGQLRYKDRQVLLENIASPSWLARVFFDLYASRFVTRINQGKKKGHHNEDKRVYLIDLPRDGETLAWQTVSKRFTETQAAVKLLRNMLRNFQNEALVADKNLCREYADTVKMVIDTHNLWEYFERTFNEAPSTWLASVVNEAGQGINEKILSIDKLIN